MADGSWLKAESSKQVTKHESFMEKDENLPE
jgi:hypothetical protein